MPRPITASLLALLTLTINSWALLRAFAKIPRRDAKSGLECARGMGGIGKPALMRESRDRNVGQRSLPQQISEQLGTQMKQMPLERGLSVREDAVEGSLGNAEFARERRR